MLPAFEACFRTIIIILCLKQYDNNIILTTADSLHECCCLCKLAVSSGKSNYKAMLNSIVITRTSKNYLQEGYNSLSAEI